MLEQILVLFVILVLSFLLACLYFQLTYRARGADDAFAWAFHNVLALIVAAFMLELTFPWLPPLDALWASSGMQGPWLLLQVIAGFLGGAVGTYVRVKDIESPAASAA